MLKQHCEICDRVIPPMESYKTVHFGRGNNPNINIGRDPIVICKKCWKIMVTAVNPEMAAQLDAQTENENHKQILQQRASEALANDIEEFIIKGKDKTCEMCAYGDGSLSDEPCNKCTGKDKWVSKDDKK